MALVVAGEESAVAQQVADTRGDPLLLLDLDPLTCTPKEAKEKRDAIQKKLKTPAGFQDAKVRLAMGLVDDAYVQINTPATLHQLRQKAIQQRGEADKDHQRLVAIAERSVELERRLAMLQH